MVVLCTPAHSPLLTFRRPRGDLRSRRSPSAGSSTIDGNDKDVYDTDDDYFGSPLRHHVYNAMYEHEIVLEDLLSERDWSDGEMLLRRGKQKLERWQLDIGVDTSQEIQKRESMVDGQAGGQVDEDMLIKQSSHQRCGRRTDPCMVWVTGHRYNMNANSASAPS